MSKKPFSLRLLKEDYIKIKKIAQYNNLSMSKQIELLLLEYIKEYEKENGEKNRKK